MCWLNERLMHIDDLADRVSFLSAELLNVLARWAYSSEKMIPSVRTREDCPAREAARALHVTGLSASCTFAQ